MAEIGVEELLSDQQVNAILAWVLVGALLLIAAGSFLTGDILWAGFAVVVTAIALVPPLSFRTPRTMLPWEILLLAGLPILGRAVATFRVSNQIATYLSVAALALIIAVELHTFTSVEMSPVFAVVFVAIATMATAGVWAVVRWSLDITLGTTFMFQPGLTEAEIERGVMLEFVASTVAGVLGGIIFEFYVRRRATPSARVAEDAESTGPTGPTRRAD